MRRLLLAICLALTLGACQQPTDAEIQLHENTMERLTSYNEIEQRKVIAACISWENSSLKRLDLKQTYTYYVGPGSDGDIFPPVLMQKALTWCNQDRNKRNLKCVCEPLDKNGKSALKVPENVASGSVGDSTSASDYETCNFAITMKDGTASWETQAAWLGHVNEAKRRDLTPQQCVELLGRT